MNYFPIFLELKNKKVLVIGGGEVACRKVDLLLKADATIFLVSPKLHPYLATLVKQKKIRFSEKYYEKVDLTNMHLVFATTNSNKLNQQIKNEANQNNIWVNVVDETPLCDFITPSIIDRTPIQVAISSNGKSPVLIRYLREKLETFLPQNLSLLAHFAGEKREDIKAQFDNVNKRRKFWESFFSLHEVENATKQTELENAFAMQLAKPVIENFAISLIHAGHDPELLSLKALRLMQQADFVLFSANLNETFLDLCRRDANRVIYATSAMLLEEVNKLSGSLRLCILTENKNHISLVINHLKLDCYHQVIHSVDAK